MYSISLCIDCHETQYEFGPFHTKILYGNTSLILHCLKRKIKVQTILEPKYHISYGKEFRLEKNKKYKNILKETLF